MTDPTTTETGELVERVRDSLSGCCAECVLFEGKPEDGRHEAWCAYEALSTLLARIEELERERDAVLGVIASAETIGVLPSLAKWKATTASLQEARGLLQEWSDIENGASIYLGHKKDLLPRTDTFLSSTKETE